MIAKSCKFLWCTFVFNDITTSFDALLQKYGSVKVHHRNLQLSAIEIYKALNNMSTAFMSEPFQIKDTKFNLRRENSSSYDIKTENYGKQSISHSAPII